MKQHLAQALTDLGTRLKMAGVTNAALQYYTEAVTVLPNYAPAYFNLGVLHSEAGRMMDAVRAYSQAITHNPQYPEALVNLGVIRKNAGQFCPSSCLLLMPRA